MDDQMQRARAEWEKALTGHEAGLFEDWCGIFRRSFEVGYRTAWNAAVEACRQELLRNQPYAARLVSGLKQPDQP